MTPILVFLCSLGNLVDVTYVPPNEVILRGVLFMGSHHDRVLFVGNFTPTISTIPASVALSSGSLIRVAPEVVEDYVYVYYQEVYKKIRGVLMYNTGESPKAKDGANMILSLSSLSPDITIVYGFYGRVLFYIGDVPESYASHMVSPGRLTYVGSTTDLSSIPIAATSNTEVRVMRLNLGSWNHVIAFLDCNMTWWLDEAPSVRVYLPCTTASPLVTTTVLSLKELQLGVHVSSGKLYEPNRAEFDHFTSGVLLFFVLVVFGTLVMWTIDMGKLVHDETKRSRLWIKMSSQNVVMCTTLLLLLLSRNMWSALQHTHGMYNIETIDMIGVDYLNVYIVVYSYCFVPTLVGTSLIILAYGNSVYATKHDPYGGWFTWNTRFFASVDLVIRVYVFIGVVTIAVLITTLYWSYMKRMPFAVVSSVYTTIVLTYWSSSSKFHALMNPLYTRWKKHDAAFLAYLAWSYKVLVLMTIPSNTPYDIGGAFALQFHTFVSLGAGVLILIITGVYMSIIKSVGSIEEIVTFLVAVAFAFSYATLFGIGSMYGTCGGIRGLSNLSILCSVTLSYGLFTASCIAGT